MATQALQRFVVCCALALALLPAAGRSVLDLDADRQPAQLDDWGDWVIDPGGDASLAAVMGSMKFKPTLHVGQPYHLQPGQALWIRFSVPATPDDQRWYVKVQHPGLDAVALYSLGHDQAWLRQASGDAMPVATWPIPHAVPTLPLGVSAEAATHHVLRIQSSDGFADPIVFLSERQLAREQQRLALGFGAYAGLLGMCTLLALATAVYVRDAAFVWLAAWTTAATLASFAVSGLGGVQLWPQSVSWNDTSAYALSPLAMTALFVFVVQACSVAERSRALARSCWLLAAGGGLAALATVWLGGLGRQYFSLTASAVVTLAAIATAAWARWHGDRVAGAFMAVCAPMLATLAWHAGAMLSWLPQPDWFIYAPEVGTVLAVAGGYFLLAQRDQQRQDNMRRVAHLGDVDPTTGLPNAAVFEKRLADSAAHARRHGHSSLVALLAVTNLDALQEEFGRERAAALLVRLAERLNSMVRNVDTVARFTGVDFALIVEGPLTASRARAFGAKVIARCIMPLAGLPQGMVVRPKVAIGLVPDHGIAAHGLIERLEAALREAMQGTASIVMLELPSGAADSSIIPSEQPGAPGPETQPSTDWQPTTSGGVPSPPNRA